ncbi:unnamed protein product, partial [Ilex paraguariensis]
ASAWRCLGRSLSLGLNGTVVHDPLIGDHDGDNLGAQGADLGQIGRVIRAVEQRGERHGLVGELPIAHGLGE